MQESYMKKSMAELRELAREKGLKGASSLRKTELIQALEQLEGAGEEKPAPQGKKKPAAPRKAAPSKRDKGAQAEAAVRETIPLREAESRPETPAQRESAARPESPAQRENPAQPENAEGAVSGAPARNTTVRINRGRAGSAGGASRGTRHFEPSAGSRNHYGSGHAARPGNGYRNRSEAGQPPQKESEPAEAAEVSRSRVEPAEPVFNGEEALPRPAAVDDLSVLDSGVDANGILEVMQDGFGFIRCENYMPGDNDIYVSPSQIRRFNMKTGDIVTGAIRIKTGQEKFAALLYVKTINGEPPSVAEKRKSFEDLTPIFPNSRIVLETPGGKLPMRIVDLLCPIGKGQRGMIVSPPKAGKTTLLKQVAKAVTTNYPEMHLIILLIDERPEEVTDMKESIEGENVEVIYSTFDELPEHHKRVSEMVLGRAKRLVEHGKDVIILLDSITRLARAYNLTVTASGRTLSGGLDPAALYMPKKFFGAARNMREGGSLTVLATALVDTGSRMDDVVFEEFKGTGNMELVLDRKLSEKRIFPAIDLLKSGTRRDDLLLSREEYEAVYTIRKALNGMKAEEAAEHILDLFARTRNNREFVQMAKKIRL